MSPFDPDPATAVKACFDRDSCKAVAPELLRTYQQAVARYHLHPEEKFRGGDYTQAGLLDRRHIRVPDVNGIEYIGKEANRWEERSQTGEDAEAQIRYGAADGSLDTLREHVRDACGWFGLRALARVAGLSHSVVLRCASGVSEPEMATVRGFELALAQLQADAAETRTVLDKARETCERIGVRELAARTGIDRANLRAVLSGRRRASPAIMERLEAVGVRDAKQR